MAPKISIVTISYNQAEYLDVCIRSVLDQDYPNLEYIIVDPGSTDGSREIIEQYRNKNVKTIFEPDKSPADGLNKGFSHSSGEILGYINADDRFVPGALDYVAGHFISNTLTDVLCGAIQIIDEQGRPSVRARTSDRFDLAKYVAGISTICQQATFFRRKAYNAAGGFNSLNRVSWDGELLVDLALAGCRFTRVNRVLGQFRLYNTSISGSQRLAELSIKEHKRISEKVRSTGVRLYGPAEKGLRKLVYKINPVRHVKYLVVK